MVALINRTEQKFVAAQKTLQIWIQHGHSWNAPQWKLAQNGQSTEAMIYYIPNCLYQPFFSTGRISGTKRARLDPLYIHCIKGMVVSKCFYTRVTRHKMGVMQCHFEPFWGFWDIIGLFGAVLGHFRASMGTWMAPGWSNITYNHVIYPWEEF